MDNGPGGPLAWLALAVAVAAALGVGLVLSGAGEGPAGVALVAAGLALVGLAVALNALLRLEGLGGEGLPGAAGVLGASLLLLASAMAAGTAPVLAGTVPAPGLLVRLEGAAWLLVGAWLARTGWRLRLLLAPSGALAWGSVAAGLATVLAAAHAQLAHADEHPLASAARVLPFLPLALWCGGLGALRLLGHPVRHEPTQD